MMTKEPCRSTCARIVAAALVLQALPLPTVALGAQNRESRVAPGFSFVDEVGESHAQEFVMRRYPGEKLMPVRILSGVKNPGTYYLPEGTDLVTTIALSGGLTATADSEKVNWNQWATKKHAQLSMDDAVRSPAKGNPTMGPNDVIFIEETRPWISTNTVTVISVVASLLGIAVAARALQNSK